MGQNWPLKLSQRLKKLFKTIRKTHSSKRNDAKKKCLPLAMPRPLAYNIQPYCSFSAPKTDRVYVHVFHRLRPAWLNIFIWYICESRWFDSGKTHIHAWNRRNMYYYFIIRRMASDVLHVIFRVFANETRKILVAIKLMANSNSDACWCDGRMLSSRQSNGMRNLETH